MGGTSINSIPPIYKAFCSATVRLFSYLIPVILVNIMIFIVIALGSELSTSKVLSNVKINKNGYLCFIRG